MELIDRKGIATATGLTPRKLNLLLRLLKAPTLEALYRECPRKTGIDLIEDCLNRLNIECQYDREKLEKAIPPSGPFITISNHPYGFLDGIVLLLVIGRLRPKFKVIANFLLSYFAPIRDLFITVNPFENSGPRRMGGKKKSLQHINIGHGLGIFPAGEVSTWYPKQQGIQDRLWPTDSMKLIKEANVPVIPIHFSGKNSLSFHLLGKIHPILRTLRIPAEFLKKRNSKIRLTIGESIPAEKIASFSTAESLRDYLQNTTNKLNENQ